MLSPEKSLLGFSKWYYLLDGIIILGTLFLTYIIITKKFSVKILLFLFIFYNTQNTTTLINGISNKTIESNANHTIVLSKNKPNIIYLVFDGFGPRVAQYFLTNNSMDSKLVNWSKDFIFYENTTSLSVAYTPTSFPNIFEGYKKSPQVLFDDLYKTNLGYYYLYDIPIQNMKKDLDKDINITFTTLDIQNRAPILLIKIYQSMPYFLRFMIANTYSWKFKNYTLWIAPSPSSKFSITENYVTQTTDIPQLYIEWIDSTHSPWYSVHSPIQLPLTTKEDPTVDDMETVLYYNTEDVFIGLATLSEKLKKMGIYDNTKIIIISDHGTHTYISSSIIDFLKKIRLKTVHELSEDALSFLPSLLMIKDFNSSNSTMKIDNRFLSLADVRGIIENSIGLTNLPDYTKIAPIKRVFNIPKIREIHSLLNSARSKTLLKVRQGTMKFIKLSNIYPYEASYFETTPLDKVIHVPPYEIIKE